MNGNYMPCSAVFCYGADGVVFRMDAWTVCICIYVWWSSSFDNVWQHKVLMFYAISIHVRVHYWADVYRIHTLVLMPFLWHWCRMWLVGCRLSLSARVEVNLVFSCICIHIGTAQCAHWMWWIISRTVCRAFYSELGQYLKQTNKHQNGSRQRLDLFVIVCILIGKSFDLTVKSPRRLSHPQNKMRLKSRFSTI